ncbi:MAG: putative metal-binding motif-containing protein [Candidatus Aenigmatarchaeota archaeon]|nr:MAG: putative metal-binding motif-containing protein [Candidatus Aenigmarchaeota archaeon]
MMRLLPLFAGFFLVFALLAFPSFSEPCQWFGTLKINNIPGDSVMVTAHRNETGEFLASGWEIVKKGQYFIELNETEIGSYIAFKIMGTPADQEPQLCESGESNKLNLTASACTDCDEDGFVSLLWGGVDCDDRDPEINPEIREICGNEIDENCDGLDPPCPNCEENWTCTEWGDCINGEQGRSCTDQNECGTTEKKPAQVQVCEIFSAGIVCNDGDLICEDDRILECFAGLWRQAEVCEFGCLDGVCNSGGITGFIVANPTAFYGIVVVIIIILIGAIYWKTRW